ncbi:hypothetical protein PSPO01_12008 [Paraphaeosphaeria sporulosa]
MNESASDTADTAICMLTLDWEPSTFNSQHSVPFPVYLGYRVNGRTDDSSDRIIHDPWVFNASFPRGVSYDGARYGCKGGTLPQDYLVSTGVCSRRNTTAPDTGHIGNNNGTWVRPGSNGTSNGTLDSPSPPGQGAGSDANDDRMITGATTGSILGFMAVVLGVYFLRRAKKRTREGPKAVLAQNLQNNETFESIDAARLSETDKDKVETGSLQIPPPTYAEAMKDSSR